MLDKLHQLKRGATPILPGRSEPKLKEICVRLKEHEEKRKLDGRPDRAHSPTRKQLFPIDRNGIDAGLNPVL